MSAQLTDDLDGWRLPSLSWEKLNDRSVLVFHVFSQLGLSLLVKLSKSCGMIGAKLVISDGNGNVVL